MLPFFKSRSNKPRRVPARLKETFALGWTRRKAVKEAVKRGLAAKADRRTILRKKYWSHDVGRFLEHYRSIHDALLKYGGGLEGKNLLHLGSALGYYTSFLQEHGVTAVALDLNRKMLRISKKIVGNRRSVQAIAARLPIQSESLDYVVSDHFLFSHYIPAGVELSVVQEAHRTLKKGGLLVIGEIRDTELHRRLDSVLGIGFTQVAVYSTKKGLLVLRKKE